jgi:hypothetical protein
MGPRLPSEITDRIIDFLHDSQTDLRTCALVCRTWLASSRFHLFEKIHINSAGGYFACRKLYKAIQQSPDIALHVRALTYSHVHTTHPDPPMPIEPVSKLLRSFTMLRNLQIRLIFWTRLTREVRESIRTLLALPTLVCLAVDSVYCSRLEHFTNLIRPHLKRLEVSNLVFLDNDSNNKKIAQACLQVDQEITQDIVEREVCRLRNLRIDLSKWTLDWLLGSPNIIDISNLITLQCDIDDPIFQESVERLLRHSGSNIEYFNLRLKGMPHVSSLLNFCVVMFLLGEYDFDAASAMDLGCHPNLRVLCLETTLDPLTPEYLAHMLSSLTVPNLQQISFHFCQWDVTEADDVTWADWAEVDRILYSEKFGSVHSVEILFKAFTVQGEYFVRQKFLDHFPMMESTGLLDVVNTLHQLLPHIDHHAQPDC